MTVNLSIISSEEYFNESNREIDWEGNNSTKVSTTQTDLLQKILTTEVSIYMLRRGYGFDQLQSDTMCEIRTEFIKKYEEIYNEKYVSYNDYF